MVISTTARVRLVRAMNVIVRMPLTDDDDLESDHEDAPNSNDGNLENSIQNN